ncbi:hypothetical protein J8J14_01485 [Roseomonas sp. SSH11]|uniref:Invasion associated locus B family protein n=1 Tax=Pararoseomonas baculiformis TaxID=2820812 RepID=A0ABS4A8W1_9PROT|nr:hypothetical protein [Pararoseomonas baculiformis]MBP0443437.1 hypothetical protein [Pararoseomonas baculiformis]
MMRPVALLLAGLLTGPALAQPATGPEIIGSWLITCSEDPMTDQAGCRMLHQQPLAPAQGWLAPLALEVEERGGRLVPVVAARNLTLEGSARGVLALTGTAELRFPPNRYFEMPCGLEGRSVVCAPREGDLERAAAELPGAERVLVRITGFLLPESQVIREPVGLRLSETPAALARLRARQPGGGPHPEAPGLWDLREQVSRLLGFLGLR